MKKFMKKNNGIFLGLIEMITEFNPVIKRTFPTKSREENSLSLSQSQNSKWIHIHVDGRNQKCNYQKS